MYSKTKIVKFFFLFQKTSGLLLFEIMNWMRFQAPFIFKKCKTSFSSGLLEWTFSYPVEETWYGYCGSLPDVDAVLQILACIVLSETRQVQANDRRRHLPSTSNLTILVTRETFLSFHVFYMNWNNFTNNRHSNHR